MKLHEKSEDFLQAIQATAQKMGIPDVFVEKDYWVTWVLRNLSKIDAANQFVFKGGTSLSKAHKILERFSEDIDLAVVAQGQNGNQIKNLISATSKKITGLPLQEIETKDTSKGSQFRKTVHQYPRLKSLSGDFGQASPNLLLEINSFTNPTPFSRMNIQCLVAEQLPESVTEYDLEPVVVNVIGLERTFVEKIMALVRASYEGENALREKVRHFYDLINIFPRVSGLCLTDPNKLKKLLSEVQETDQKIIKDEWIKQPILEAPLFKDLDGTIEKARPAYEGTEFKALVWGKMPLLNVSRVVLEQVSTALQKS